MPCRLPDDDVLQSELTARGYGYDSSRRLKMESKEQMRGRNLRSPDSADAVVLTFAVPLAAGSVDSGWAARRAARQGAGWRQ
jgi:hypothetical protein